MESDVDQTQGRSYPEQNKGNLESFAIGLNEVCVDALFNLARPLLRFFQPVRHTAPHTLRSYDSGGAPLWRQPALSPDQLPARRSPQSLRVLM
jgi:hypothetical protein